MKRNQKFAKRGRFNFLRNFTFIFRDTFLYNYIVRFQRYIHSKGVNKLRLPNLRNTQLPKVRFSGLILIVVVFALVVVHILLYFKITPQPYFQPKAEDASPYNRVVYDNSINVLFIGFENRLNDYRYVDSLTVASFDTQSNLIKLYGIDPNFVINGPEGDFTIRTLWNNITVENKTRLDEFIASVQSFLALRIDRYFAFDLSNFKDYLNETGYKEPALTAFTSNGVSVSSGDMIGGDILFNYLFDKKESSDDIVLRQTNFLKNFLNGMKGFWGFYYNVINIEAFTKVFKTDFSRGDLFNFIVSLNSYEVFTSNKYYLASKFGAKSVDPLVTDLSPDFNLIDENLTAYFNNLEVLKEQAAIEIYNGTDIPGLAGNRRRFFHNLGGNVIKFGNYPESDIKQTILYVPSKNVEKYKNNIIMIRRTLRGNVKISFDDFKFNYSGDLLLVLGDDSINI